MANNTYPLFYRFYKEWASFPALGLLLVFLSVKILLVDIDKSRVTTSQIEIDYYLQDMDTDSTIFQHNEFSYNFWTSSLFLSISTLIGICILTLVLKLILSIFQRGNILFADVLKSVILAELVLLVSLGVKLAYFLWVSSSHGYEEIMNFYPLSLLSLFNYLGIRLPIKPEILGIINFFQILYIFILILGLSYFIDQKMKNIAKVVIGIFGFLWIFSLSWRMLSGTFFSV